MRRRNSYGLMDSHRARKPRTYRTQCKTCKEAIYTDESASWLTSPMGLSHDRCVTP